MAGGDWAGLVAIGPPCGLKIKMLDQWLRGFA